MEEHEESPYTSPETVGTEDRISDGTEDLASLGLRLGGAIIDNLILSAVVIPFFLVTGTFDFIVDTIQGKEVAENTTMAEFKNALISVVIFFALNTYLLVTRGQTIGKKILNTQIVSADESKELDNVRLIGKRYLILKLAELVPTIGGLYSLVDALFIFGKKRQRLSDRIANTKVIKIPQA